MANLRAPNNIGFVRGQVTPRLTAGMARLGYAHRGALAGNLKGIQLGQSSDHARLLDLMASRGILKSSFRQQLTSLDQLDDHMLSARVGRLQIDGLIQESAEIFPGSKPALDNIAAGLYATANSSLAYLSGSQSGHDNMSLAFVLGAGTAATIGATLAGVPATALIGTGMVYSIVSTLVSKHVNPNSSLGKITEVGRRIFPLTLGAAMLYGTFVTYGAGMMFSEAVGDLLGGIPSYLLPLVGLGGMGAGAAVWSAVNIRSALGTRLGHVEPLSEQHIKKTIILSNAKIMTGINYLTYRTILYGAFVACAVAFNFSPLGLAGLGVGLVARFAVSKTTRERLTEGFWNYSLKKINEHKKTPINGDDHPLAKMLVEYGSGMAIKYGALVGAGLYFAADPAGALFDLATIYFGAWTIFADFHSQTASIGSAINWKRSMFNAMEVQISDAEREQTRNPVARAVAYINDVDRNFAKIANMLLTETPFVEAVFCGELHPLNNLNAVRQLRAARRAHALMADWQKELYDQVHQDYLQAKAKGASGGRDLAILLRKLGESYASIGEGTYVHRIRELIRGDNQHEGPDKWFALAGDEAYVRQTYEALRLRGLVYLELAQEVESALAGNYLKAEEVKELYEYLDGIYRTTFVHFQRKLESLDDMLGTKTANLSSMESHMGDTLYHVWRMETFNRQERLQSHLVPSTYVRVKNPAYQPLQGQSAENLPYLWIRREDFLPILGLSQSFSNDIQLVDNTPGNIREIEQTGIVYAYGEESLIVRGFYSDQETLPANHLIDWQGRTIAPSDDLWVATQTAPANFVDRFRAWASSHYGKDYETWLASQGPGALWFIDRPEVLVVSPAEYYNVCDEAYIVWDTERELSAELNKTAEDKKIVRVVNYVPKKADYPNPDPSRPVEQVKTWRLQDSPIGLKYRTTDGREFDIPYPENRSAFATGLGNDKWKEVAQAVVEPNVNGQGKHLLRLYDTQGREIGVVTTEWPHNMHPPEQIARTSMTIIEKGEDGKDKNVVREVIRIEVKVFPERVGMATWLVADYGDNYGPEPYNRFRSVFLDFEREAKQEFWPNFITGLTASKDGQRVSFTTISTKCETFPFDKRWAGIDHAHQAEVLEVAGHQVVARVHDDNSGWIPVRTGGASEVILLARTASGEERVFSLPRASGKAFTLPELRKVVDLNLESGELVKLRYGNRTADNPSFIYSLPAAAVEESVELRRLKWILRKQDLTAHFEQRADGSFSVSLYDEQNNLVDISLPTALLVDNSGQGFLANRRFHLDSLASFYQRSDHAYQGTEEYRPRLAMIEGEIKLILTRVTREKVKLDQKTHQALQALAPTEILLARPTSAIKIGVTDANGNRIEKWVPASLTNPIVHEPSPNQAKIAITNRESNGHPSTTYTNLPLVGELPDQTYFLRYEGGRFIAYTMAAVRKENGAIVYEPVASPTAVSEPIQQQLRQAIGDRALREAEINVDIFYTRRPEVIDGEYQSVVHGQRQHGLLYKDEAVAAGEQAQFRDEYFYGVVKGLFSEILPFGLEPRSGGLQIGKDQDYDANDKWSGKPIENGTQFLGQHKHLFELAEVLMGVPKGGLIAYAAALGRLGGFEPMLHKPHFAKLVLYCREKGWLTGVSEDEQGVLALALALGYTLKYFVRVTAFESQPNTYGQIDGQDARRYNTALALGEDVLLPYEYGELARRAAGKEIASTWKQKFEHLLFRMWYEVPKAELSRELSPAIFLFTNGAVKPYIVDPYFLLSYFLDFGAGLAMYSGARKMLGRNKEMTADSALMWSFIKGPQMNQAFFFQSTRGILELFRKGWQYGQFVVTASQKDNPTIAEVNKDFLRHLSGLQIAAAIYGMATTIPGALSIGQAPVSLGYFFNEFWALYGAGINLASLEYIKQCERSHGKADKKDPAVAAFQARRQEYIKKIDQASDEIGDQFFQAVRAFHAGKRVEAERLFRSIVEEDKDFIMPNYLILSLNYLERLGVSRHQLKIGKMLRKGQKEEKEQKGADKK